MAYGQRDMFLQAIVVFTTSDKAKEMPLAERQEILLEIRNKYSPSITNEEWSEIAEGVNNFKYVITEAVKYGEIPTIEKLMPKKEKEMTPKIETDEDDDVDDDGVTEETDYSEPEPIPPKEPDPKVETQGRFYKKQQPKTHKINTSILRGLLKLKKNNNEPQ